MKKFKTTIATVLCSASVLCTCCSAFADTGVTAYNGLTISNSVIGTMVKDTTTVIDVNTNGKTTVNTGKKVVIDGSVIGTFVDKDGNVIKVKPNGSADVGTFNQTFFNNSAVGTYIQDSFKYFDAETR